MPYDSSDMSYGDIETDASYDQSREMYCYLSLDELNF